MYRIWKCGIGDDNDSVTFAYNVFKRWPDFSFSLCSITWACWSIYPSEGEQYSVYVAKEDRLGSYEFVESHLLYPSPSLTQRSGPSNNTAASDLILLVILIIGLT